MRRFLLTLLVVVALAVPAAIPAISRAQTAHAEDPISAWNQFLLTIQSTPGEQPATVHPTYELAVVQTAMYDAVASIDPRARPYLTHVAAPRHASLAAAADAAARDTLTALYPDLQASISTEYSRLLAQLPAGRPVSQGIRVGEQVAGRILVARVDDGSSAAPIAFRPGMEPGAYQLTPPAFGPPVFTHWRFVRPFVLQRAAQFRPPAPAALTSAKYAAAVDEVERLGVAQGSTRTPDQTQIGLFWNPPIWATWNRIAETAALGHPGTLTDRARTFAQLNLTFTDSTIAFYDAKYTFRLWRPVTAIRQADADGNPETSADPAWTPLSATAADPSYPGAHGTISAAGAAILSSAYGNEFAFGVTSPALPGVERTFVSFSEAAEEASVSRIYNGNHTRIDEVAGENLGSDVAAFVLRATAGGAERR
jgi:hypothetical protein